MPYDCSCDLGDPAEFLNVSERKARKAHSCEECRAVILPGEKYEYVSGKWDGKLNDFKTCALCVELREWATISVPCFCVMYGSLHDDATEMVREVSPDVPGMFFEFGRRMVKIKRVRKARRETISK